MSDSSSTWIAPAVIVGIFSIIIGAGVTANTFWLGGRFTAVEDRVGKLETRNGDLNTRIDQRFDKLSDVIQAQSGQINARIDKLIDSQSALTIQIGKTETAIADLNGKIDKISLKLKVASNADDPPLIAGSSATDALEAAGFKVLNLKTVAEPAKEAVVKEITNEKNWFAVTPDTNNWEKAIAIMKGDVKTQNPKDGVGFVK